MLLGIPLLWWAIGGGALLLMKKKSPSTRAPSGPPTYVTAGAGLRSQLLSNRGAVPPPPGRDLPTSGVTAAQQAEFLAAQANDAALIAQGQYPIYVEAFYTKYPGLRP